MHSILFHAREAGIAYVISSMLDNFIKEDFKLFFDVKSNAAEILPQEPYKSPDKVDLIICGYVDNKIDKTGIFLKKIKSNHIPVLGILDSWKGVERFWYSDGSLRELTDKLVVSDNSIRDFLINKGVPDFWPTVIGHPAIDCMAGFNKYEKNKFRETGRSLLGLNEHDKILLFLSEPLNLSKGKKISLLDTNTNDNKSLKDWINLNYNKKYKVVLRLHPIERNNVPEYWFDGNKLSLEQAIFSSDLVMGLSSTSLPYAIAAGKKVKNLQGIISDWVPEYSNIPSSLWNKLEKFNLFKSVPNCSPSLNNLISTNSSEQIISLVRNLIADSTPLD